MTTRTIRSTLFALSAFALLASNAAYAEHAGRDGDENQWLLGIASSLLLSDGVLQEYRQLPNRSHRERRIDDRHKTGSDHGRGDYRRDFYRGDGRGAFAASYTSEPIRGGSSRRTRVIENPFPGRPITGISFTGIERGEVHINDVIVYPRKRLISHRGYSLSVHHPSPFLSARGYVDYISVKAKRKEYFTVTFHYD